MELMADQSLAITIRTDGQIAVEGGARGRLLSEVLSVESSSLAEVVQCVGFSQWCAGFEERSPIWSPPPKYPKVAERFDDLVKTVPRNALTTL